MTLLIVGASARAAAFSALRARLDPIGVDLFADRDLHAVCPVHIIAGFEDSLPLNEIARNAPAGPWLYTGALENRPGLVDRIASVRPLWGNTGAVLRAVRDPFQLATAIQRAGLPCPEVRRLPDGLPVDGSWLVKPWHSAGGWRIRTWRGEDDSLPQPLYFQERIPGRSGSALFVGSRSGARLLGITRQWIGRPGMPFAYVGSLGPWPITEPARVSIERFGEQIGATFELLGLFGVDFVLRDEVPFPVEVNPRYTASVEVLELVLGRSFLREHQRSFELESGSPLDQRGVDRSSGVVGKAIVFAPTSGRFPDRFDWGPLPQAPWSMPLRADLPAPGSRFGRGQPVLTILERASSLSRCRQRLAQRLERWERRLRRWSSEPV